jgi:CARDB
VILLILVAIGVHGCEVSEANSALKDYSDNVSELIQSSDQTGSQFFSVMSSGQGSSNATGLRQQIDNSLLAARAQLSRAESLSVPDQMKTAQTYLLLALKQRVDGLADISQQVEAAVQAPTSTAAVEAIAADMARFYSSDVVYKDYTLPEVAAGLHSAGIPVGGANGQPLNEGQFFPSLQWLTPAYVADALKVTISTPGAKCSGLHGHALNSVSVAGTQLQTGATNTIPASPPPTFSLNITNGGDFTENNVTLKVTISGSTISGQTVIPQTTAGETTTGQVTLKSSPPAGNYTVTAEVVPVPCETNTANNTLTFPVTFQ